MEWIETKKNPPSVGEHIIAVVEFCEDEYATLECFVRRDGSFENTDGDYIFEYSIDEVHLWMKWPEPPEKYKSSDSHEMQ